jgi:hypothetical protein
VSVPRPSAVCPENIVRYHLTAKSQAPKERRRSLHSLSSYSLTKRLPCKDVIHINRAQSPASRWLGYVCYPSSLCAAWWEQLQMKS